MTNISMRSKKNKIPGPNASALRKLKAAVSSAQSHIGSVRRGKSKRTRKGSSGVVTTEQLQPFLEQIPKNPFETKVARHKYDVLHRSIRGAQGKPEVSRTRGLELRKTKLLSELTRAKKVNTFHDNRFGENHPDMSIEDKMLERFTRERLKTSRHASIYNLEDDEKGMTDFGEKEDLMHNGRRISDIPYMETIHMSDDDSEDGGLDAQRVGETHFGGFLRVKRSQGPELEHEQSQEPFKTRKEVMEDIITKSKMYRMERQKLRMETEDLTWQLNEDFGELRSLLLENSTDQGEASAKTANDPEVGPRRVTDSPMLREKLNLIQCFPSRHIDHFD
jgi:nucleolar protein 14